MISVVTPSYNQVSYLEDTLRSVLTQEYPNLEYIVMDGGSDDGSQSTIERYASKLAYWQSEPDRGMYDALNKGFARSTGEIMGWINSDDLHLPWTLHVVGAIFRAFPSVNWLTTLQRGGCGPTGIPSFDSMPGYSFDAFRQGRYGGSPHELPGYGHIQQESTFWRRELWEASEGLNLSYYGASDFDLWCQFYEHDRLYGVDLPLGVFRRHAEQKTSDASYSYETECRDALKRHFGPVAFSKQHWATRLRLPRTPVGNLVARFVGFKGKYITRYPIEEEWVLKHNSFL